MSDIITLAGLKTYLGSAYTGTTEDGVLSALITMVSKLFDNYVGCPLISATYASLILDGNGRRTLRLPYWPVTAIGVVSEDGDVLTNGGDEADFYLRPELGLLEKRAGEVWIDTPDIIEISSLVAGYLIANIPGDMQLMAYREVARYWKEEQGRAWGVTSRSVGDGSVTYVEHGDLMKSTKSILDQYRRIRV